jgi:SAM-dependent methyltransferase
VSAREDRVTVEGEGQSAAAEAPRFALARPKDIHTATPWHRYSHYIKTLPKALRAAIGDLKLQPSARLLDYGCADMPYRDFFPQTLEYVGADLPGNPDATIDLNPDATVPAEESSFDAVISTQVLEHVGDPALYLSECFRVLKPGGRLLLSTHGVFVYHPDPVDYWRWTCAGLQKQVEAAGFEVVRFQGVFGLVAIGLQTVQDGIYWHLPRLLRPAFALVMQGLIKLADGIQSDGSRRLNASVFVVVAAKP